MSDQVNHPKHYTFSRYEVIDVITKLGCGYSDGNAIKYLARSNFKGKKIEDLKKSEFYINYLLKTNSRQSFGIFSGLRKIVSRFLINMGLYNQGVGIWWRDEYCRLVLEDWSRHINEDEITVIRHVMNRDYPMARIFLKGYLMKIKIGATKC